MSHQDARRGLKPDVQQCGISALSPECSAIEGWWLTCRCGNHEPAMRDFVSLIIMKIVHKIQHFDTADHFNPAYRGQCCSHRSKRSRFTQSAKCGCLRPSLEVECPPETLVGSPVASASKPHPFSSTHIFLGSKRRFSRESSRQIITRQPVSSMQIE